MTIKNSIVEGNLFDKYHSPNRLHQLLVNRFLSDCRSLVQSVTPTRILEVGCGPGDLAARALTLPNVDYVGIDISHREVFKAASKLPHHRFAVAAAESLPFGDSFADLVVGCEVIEHLHEPAIAIAEISRVSSKFALLSVPWEPMWRILNCARGKYWSSLGNTPGHLQHFSREEIRKLVANHFDVIEERKPFPWTMLLLRKPLPNV
ncbi:class I SAM-dependent methyltransferase [Roseiconus lacunae]|uniref:class I SAM-dependent methyltransferase n=1 Tax=Roseiconus lacunae TaxID=2605694 RepID=UPI001E336A53|nr:class I SAM-dependent methyltransferase [Roseiconus lacunae]